MKKFIAMQVLVLMMLLSAAGPVMGASADNVYVNPVNPSPSDIVMSDWMAVQTTPYTYWATQNWNQGAEGGGYAGFQQDDGNSFAPRRVHFAIWDPINSTLPITAKYVTPGGRLSPFGGEGTGMKVMTPYAWQTGQWYRMVVRTWSEGCTGTCFGQWVKDAGKNEWKLIAVLDHPVAGLSLHGGLGLFQEDWNGTAQNVREGRIKNGYNRKLDGTWNSWAGQRISTNSSLGNWDGGTAGDYFWFRAGGSTTPSIASNTVKTVNQPTAPAYDSIVLASTGAAYKNGQLTVNWQLPASSSPQFKVSAAVYGNAALAGSPLAGKTEVRPEAVSQSLAVSLKAGRTYYVKLTITDLFDRTRSVTIPVKA
ncbi:DUF3472 domain-containing protein [Paenibacillus sp. RC84]|uniref:DUF3472 domain-containing protein n=1 Tax=Paenibacillus sp. RC84 TaxID=3156252 RepID=UPI0035170324